MLDLPVMSDGERNLSAGTPRVLVPRAPVLVAGFREILWLSPDGDIEALAPAEARGRVEIDPPMLCHAIATARRLDSPGFAGLDLLELFAFVYPARFCVPTPRGLAEALGLPPPRRPAEACVSLAGAAQALLQALGQEVDAECRAVAEAMDRGGWLWAPAVLAALPPAEPGARRHMAGLRVWTRLAEWSETAPGPPPGNSPVTAAEARSRLARLLGADSEPRPQQADYAAALAAAFAPRDLPDRPHAVLAEAGTGVGKTLGYIAPASLWAEKNGGAVWISTFTRNLQTQIAGELDRLYPDLDDKRRRVVVRKGRENFLCLLNYEEAAAGAVTRPGRAAAQLGLVARWILASEAGDLVGGDFPGWLTELIGRARVGGLADRRGECVHSACHHFRRCFVEKNIRKARGARIVVANHALVMTQAALGGLDDATVPTRYVFDEGHHLLEAADNAFSVRLSGREGRELRRWIVGAEGAGGSRARGLRRRIGDLVDGEDDGTRALIEVLAAARILPGDGWAQRAAEGRGGPGFEGFLALVRQQVLARAALADAGYGLQAEARPPVAGLAEVALPLAQGLLRLAAALQRLAAILRARLEDPENPPEPGLRQRLDATLRGLDRRADQQLAAWARLLRDLTEPPRPETVEWLALDRIDGFETDVAVIRSWIDPGIPFARLVARPAHGLVVTSATLTDGDPDPDLAWRGAEAATGLRHLGGATGRRADRLALQLSGADPHPRRDRHPARRYRPGGGGLCRAVRRRRAAARSASSPRSPDCAPCTTASPRCSKPAACCCWPSMSRRCRPRRWSISFVPRRIRACSAPTRSATASMFRAAPCASWCSTGCHGRARISYTGPAGRCLAAPQYSDRIARLRLRQAYGRLIRRADDRGVFVVLDRALPSRLMSAFPDGVAISRLPLAEAVDEIRRFLGTADPSLADTA